MPTSTHGILDGGVRVGGLFGGATGLVEALQPLLSLREMAIVEGIRVHLHKQHHAVQYEEDLSSPRPVEYERHSDPERQPDDLVYALDGHATLVPGQRTAASSEQLMQRQADGSTPDHEELGNGQVPGLDGEEAPDLHTQGVAGVFVIAQHGSDAHDGQADPEEVEEAMKVTIVGVGIKVGDA